LSTQRVELTLGGRREVLSNRFGQRASRWWNGAVNTHRGEAEPIIV
jgi:hypothetical protein